MKYDYNSFSPDAIMRQMALSMMEEQHLNSPLVSAIIKIGNAFDLDYGKMDTVVSQDPHGGYNAAYEDGFPIGSMWRVEGQMLYALIRALKPASVLELGTSRGCSATHMLQALRDNGTGTLDCVDNGSQVAIIGDMIPDELRYHDSQYHVTFHPTSIELFIPYALEMGFTYDFILEDAMHSFDQVKLVWENADKLLNLGGMIVSHDAMHAIAGPIVRDAIAAADYEDTMGYGNGVGYVLIEPADCGFAIWRKRLA